MLTFRGGESAVSISQSRGRQCHVGAERAAARAGGGGRRCDSSRRIRVGRGPARFFEFFEREFPVSKDRES